jgi:hypothetical protein
LIESLSKIFLCGNNLWVKNNPPINESIVNALALRDHQAIFAMGSFSPTTETLRATGLTTNRTNQNETAMALLRMAYL